MDKNTLTGSLIQVFPPGHPPGNVTLAMQHPPDIDMFILFDVENKIWKASERPVTKVRQIQSMRIMWRSGCGMARDMRIGPLQSVDEINGCLIHAFTQIIINGGVNILIGHGAWNNRFGFHFPEVLFMRARNPSK